MNGYFQILHTEQDTSLKLVPPTENGEKIDINDLMAYLHRANYYDVDTSVIYNAIRKLDQTRVVKIAGASPYEETEQVLVTVADDRMTAFARFYPPSSGGKNLTKDDILQNIKQNVRYGIDESVIDNFLKSPQYCTDFVIAKGEEPKQGHDGYIEYTFNTDLNTRPARNPDGSVDFFSLNTINHCKAGEVLARMIKEEQGEPGCNVLGETIAPRLVKGTIFKYGRNIELSEDKLSLISKLNGHVALSYDTVVVSDVYEVNDVGPATGNVESEGSVLVRGNVQAGYSIKAHGNVEVFGVVEGATIEAGGDIILARGMNGMGKGVLKAGGSIISKFFENSTITSENYVEADSILHSNVVARTEVCVDGRKGFIAGGCVRATNKVSCKTLGSAMGADTIVEVGIDPGQKIRYQEIQKEMMVIQKNLKSIQPIIVGLTTKLRAGVKLTAEQVKYLQSLMAANEQQTKQLEQLDMEFDILDRALKEKQVACICVSDKVYAGTKLTVMDASLILKNEMSYCRFIYEKGEVKSTNY